MMKVAFVLALCVACVAAKGVHWSYTDSEAENGPSHWGDLSPDFAKCTYGKDQSPINIVSSVPDWRLEALIPNYMNSPLVMDSTEKPLRKWVFPKADNKLWVEGREHRLTEVRFHSPSEHKLKGMTFPIEFELVHEFVSNKKEKEYVIVSVLGARDSRATNKKIESILRAFDSRIPPEEYISPLELLPEKMPYYVYQGSLSTPPCSEPARRFVINEYVQVHPDLIDRWTALAGVNTARPVQGSVGDRVVKNFKDDGTEQIKRPHLRAN